EKARAGSGRLVQEFVVPGAVVADRRRADQDCRPLRRRSRGVDERARRIHATLENRLLAHRSPAAGSDRLAGEVDEGVGGGHGLSDGVPTDGGAGGVGRVAAGTRSATARLSTRLLDRPRSFRAIGRRHANSTRWWSRYGARPSSDAAMVARSSFGRRSSARYPVRSSARSASTSVRAGGVSGSGGATRGPP